MRISKHIHSCLLIEDGDTRILVDPGSFTFAEHKVSPADFPNLQAILITHDHTDHVEPNALKAILARSPSAVVYGNSNTQASLGKEGVAVEIFEEGSKIIGSINIEALPADHAALLGVTPPQNTAYLFNIRVLVSGDTLDPRLATQKGVEVLAAPIMAPWGNQIQIAEFLTMMAPKIFVPVHDAFAKDFFREWQYKSFTGYLAEFGSKLHPLELGEYLEV